MVSCLVAPGFDFGDFELAARDDLLAAHPADAEIIRALARWLCEPAPPHEDQAAVAAALRRVAEAGDPPSPSLPRRLRRAADRVESGAAAPEKAFGPLASLHPALDQLLLMLTQFRPVFRQDPNALVPLLQETYQADGVDLYVPLMTDYEQWLAGQPKCHLWEPTGAYPLCRVEFKKKVAREQQGRIHPFAPFCPLRAAADLTRDLVARVVDLVQTCGFLGVKLYPTMGYYPCDNALRLDPVEGAPAAVDELARTLASARRPVLLAGRGAWRAGAGEALRRVA